MKQLIDTGAILASLDRRDKYHQQAAQYIQNQQNSTFYLPDAIFAETMTLIKARMGPRMAIIAGERLRESKLFIIEPMSADEIWSTFAKYDDKAWSFADCSLLVLAQRLNITIIFSFDHHIDQTPTVVRKPNI